MVTYEEIKKRIQLLRRVSEGDEVLYTDPHEIAEIMLEIIEYIEERGWTHSLIPKVRSVCEELLTTRALDFVQSELWRKMAQAIRDLFQISKEIKFTIWVEKVEEEYGGGYVNVQGKIYLNEPEGYNGGGYAEGYHGTGYVWDPEGYNGGAYVNVE
ncbi:hypothetical protein DRN38_00060 [Thermococci archaeon]|nr:MAG: hypothetical protein DRN38_00060 [Thermococci archaeon]